jgi:hypothetical protein
MPYLAADDTVVTADYEGKDLAEGVGQAVTRPSMPSGRSVSTSPASSAAILVALPMAKTLSTAVLNTGPQQDETGTDPRRCRLPLLVNLTGRVAPPTDRTSADSTTDWSKLIV